MAENTPNSFLPLGNTTEELAGLHGKEKQFVVDTIKNTLVVMDGVTLGGHPLAKEDTKIKSGSEDVIINDSTEATLAGDVTIKNKPWGIVLDGEFPTDEEELAELANRVPVGGSVYGLAPLGPEDAIPAPYNDEIWITESGDWEVPCDGYYDITTIDGGKGGFTSSEKTYIYSGQSGDMRKGVVKLTKGQIIPITIGAGGIGVVGTIDIGRDGTATTFGNISLKYIRGFCGELRYRAVGSNIPIAQAGGGRGNETFVSFTTTPDGTFYGAGGGAYIYDDSHMDAGDGYQGCVIIRFYNPNKN